MKLKLYTASGAFIADCEVGGTDYPEIVRWGDRVFELWHGDIIPKGDYWEMDIPQVRSLVTR